MPTVSASLLLAFMISPAATNAPINLKWKFAEGDVLYLKSTEDCESTGFDKGKVVKQEAFVHVVNYKLAVTSVTEAGTSLELTYGSNLFGEAETLRGIKLAPRKDPADGQSFTFVLKPDGKVTKIRGNNALWDAAPRIRPEHTAELLSAALLRTIPGKRLRVGDNWASESGYPISDGFMEVKARSRLDSVTRGVVKLVAEVDHTWDSRGAKTNSWFDEMNGENGTRTTWFDLNAGRVVKMEMTYTMTGPLRAPWQGSVVTHQQKHTIEVSDTPPKEE